MTKNKSKTIRMITTLSLLIAIEIILSRFFSIQTWNFKIGFGFIPVVIAGALYGPIAGGLVGGISDFLGAIMFPKGAYFFGFTITAIFLGVMYGLVLKKKQTNGRILFVVFMNQTMGSLLLNTYWISVISGASFYSLLPTRLIQYVIIFIAQLIVIKIISAMILPRLHDFKIFD